MKNICFFNSVPFWGGGEKLHLENAVEFKKKGYNVVVASNPKSLLYKKAKIEKLCAFPVVVRNISFLNPIKIIIVALFYRKHKIDTVFFSTSQDLKLGGISAKLAGVNKIIYLRGLAVPIKASLINRFIFKTVLTHIISNSEETKKCILKHLCKYIKNDKVHTIYHGIYLKKLNSVDNSELDAIKEKGHGVILGNAGRLTAQKGHDELIKIAKKIKDFNIEFTLFIAGTGELQSKLQQQIDDLDLCDNVILLGFVKDIDSFMNSVDIFLLSSIWEGFGYVLVEAMIKSKPIVAFDITSNPEIVTANETGFLVDYPDLDMFAEKTIKLIQNKDLRETMGDNGKKSVIDRFLLEDRVSEIETYLLSDSKIQVEK